MLGLKYQKCLYIYIILIYPCNIRIVFLKKRRIIYPFSSKGSDISCESITSFPRSRNRNQGCYDNMGYLKMNPLTNMDRAPYVGQALPGVLGRWQEHAGEAGPFELGELTSNKKKIP